jgi:hypothetical protein
MWILLFVIAILFILGSALILLRTALSHRIPDQVKSQPYDDDSNSGW